MQLPFTFCERLCSYTSCCNWTSFISTYLSYCLSWGCVCPLFSLWEIPEISLLHQSKIQFALCLSNSFMFPQRQLTVWIKYNGSLWFAQRVKDFSFYHFCSPQGNIRMGIRLGKKNSQYWWLGLIISWYKRIILSSIKSQSSLCQGDLISCLLGVK